MKILQFILLFVIFTISETFAQKSICKLTYEEFNFLECLLESPDVGAMDSQIIKIITEEIGIAPNFTLKNCPSIQNAIAVINPLQNNSRYILFDMDFFKYVYRNYQENKYAGLFVIAHELAHHINGHTISKNISSILELQKRELEADYFAGFILFKVGASEYDIIETLNKFPEPLDNYSSHPRNSLRIKYALAGFFNEANKYKAKLYRIQKKIIEYKNEQFERELGAILAKKNSDFKQEIKKTIDRQNRYYQKKIEEFNRVTLKKKIDNLISELNKYGETNQNSHLDIAEYIINGLNKQNPIVEEIQAFINLKKGRFELAYPYYKKKYLEKKDTDDLVNLLEIASEIPSESIKTDIIKITREIKNNSKVFLNLGIFYKSIGDNIQGFSFLKKAYESIKDEDETVLKSDILYSYARAIYDEQCLKKTKEFTFSKTLLIKAKKIIEKYSFDNKYQKYYNSILFLLGNIYFLDDDTEGAISTYNKLLKTETNRTDYLYKVNASLGNIYHKLKKYSHAIQYYTQAINICDDSKQQAYYYYCRGKIHIANNNIELGIVDMNTSCEMGFSQACINIKQ